MLPLAGVKVLDFNTAIAGAVGSQYLGDMGADVAKVEPLEGDFTRLTASGRVDSPRFMSINRNKRSLCVNLKDREGRKIGFDLARRTDVIISSFRHGVMDRLALGYEEIVKVNPDVIYVSLTGYGKTGPLANQRGADPWAQAMGGVVSIQGSPEGPPFLGGVAWVDQGAGIIIALGTMMALFVRERTGTGQRVDLNLLDVCLSMQTAQLGDYLIDNRLLKKGGRGWAGDFPYGPYAAKDGEVVLVYGRDNGDWKRLCELLEIDHIATDPKYDSRKKRLERREELYPILDRAFTSRTRTEWQLIFGERGIPVPPCLTYEELFSHPQVEANEIVQTVEHPVEGPTRMIGIPMRLSKTPGGIRRASPLLGEHTREILRDLGYNGRQLGELQRKGAIYAASVGDMKRRKSIGGWGGWDM